MSLSVACPSCGSKLRAPDNVAGRLIKCPKCGNPFRVRNDAAQLKRPTPPSCKPAPVPDVLTVDVTRLKQTRRLSPIVLVAWGIVGLFILAFGVTVGLVLNFTVKPTELAENKEVASGSRTESHEPSRLLDERDVDNQAPVEPPRRSPAPDPEALAAEKHRREEKAKADSERKAKEKAETEPRKAEEKAETERKAARKKTEEKSEVEKAKITSLDDIVAKFSGAEKTYVEAYIRNRFRRPRIPEWDIGSNRLLQRSISSLQTGEIGILGFISGKVVRVRQVVNDREVLAAGQGADGREQGDFWIEGVDTKDIADGDLVGVEKLVLVVAGAKRYRTVLGATRSVKHFVVLDIEKLEAAVVRMYTEAKREEEKRQRQERERQKKEEVQRRAAAEETRRQEAARAEEARRQQEARAAEAKRQEDARIKASVAQNRAALNGPDRKTRIQAAIELGKLGPRAADAVPELSKALVDENEQFSKAAADALAKIGKPATPALIDTLANGTPRSRRNAASALVSMNDDAKESVPAPDATVRKLKAMFRDTDEAVLLAAVLDALAIVGGLEQSMVDQLLTNKGLQHSDAAVRSKALDCLRRVAVDKVRIETLAKLNLEDPSPDVRNHAYKALSARIDHLSEADMKDVRALIAMTRKPDAVAIGLTAVKHLGPKAKDALPELLKLLAAADQKRKLELALLLVDIDAKSYTVTKAVSPVLVASLRPESASEAVLKAIVAVGRPVVDDIFKALEKADDIGVVNAAHRKALYQALYRLGREAYSEGNLETIRYHYKKERYRDVREEAGNALVAMKRAKNE